MKYLMPMARNTKTGQTVKSQDLSGRRYPLHQRSDVEKIAERLAEDLTSRTRDTWQAVVRSYTV